MLKLAPLSQHPGSATLSIDSFHVQWATATNCIETNYLNSLVRLKRKWMLILNVAFPCLSFLFIFQLSNWVIFQHSYSHVTGKWQLKCKFQETNRKLNSGVQSTENDHRIYKVKRHQNRDLLQQSKDQQK